MENEELIKILKEHNQWRRGLKPYDEVGSTMPHDPRDLGLAIEDAIKRLELFDEMVEALGWYACSESCEVPKYKDGSCYQGENCGKRAQQALNRYKEVN